MTTSASQKSGNVKRVNCHLDIHKSEENITTINHPIIILQTLIDELIPANH